MGILRQLFTKRFLKNVIAGIAIALIFPVVLYIYLDWYTGHGVRLIVPDLRGVTVSDAMKTLEDETLVGLVVDSVFTEGAVSGMVFEQSPAPFAEVKRGRTVYLTVYRTTPPSETLKVDEGMNERVAEIILQNKGIRFDKQYEEHAYLSGMVIRVLQRGRELTPDSRVKRGDRVMLIVGMRSNERIPIPNLVGLTVDSANQLLLDRRLAQGVTLYDSEIVTAEDSLNARIYRQNPSVDPDKNILVGTPVDVFVGLGKAPEADDFFIEPTESEP